MKANYFRVGLFVTTAIAMITIAVVILGAGLFEKNEILFETYLDESVSGLSIGSPVELRGVRIGKVEQISFAAGAYDITPDQRRQSSMGRCVRVVISVLPRPMSEHSDEERIDRWQSRVNRGLRLRLASNIITGQAFIEGAYVDPNRYPPPELPWNPEYTFIPSSPSELTTLKDSVDQILRTLQQLDLERLFDAVEKTFVTMERTITDANVPQVSRDIRELVKETRLKMQQLNTEQITASVQKALDSVDRAIADANVPAISEQANALFAELRQTNEGLKDLVVSPDTDLSQSNLPETISRLNRTLSRMDRLLATERPQIELILANFAQISENLKDLTETLKQNPAGLLRSTPPKHPEASK